VADVSPFRALVYAEPEAGVVSPPYDVISPAERDVLMASSPHNAVRLILPEVAYEQVGRLIAGWRGRGVLRLDDRPALFAWTQTFTLDGAAYERRTLLAAVGLEPYERRVVRPHERTHAGPREDRLRLVRAVGVNLSPVFGLYPDPGGEVWAAAAVEGAPGYELTDREGTVHRVWELTSPERADAVARAMAERWILIADGHHRYETALAYRNERPEADRVMFGLTALEDPGLVVLPTHRVLARWPEDAAAAFRAERVPDLEALLAALAGAPPSPAPAFGLVRPDGAALLTAAPVDDASPAAALDTAVLEREILMPAFGADQAALSARDVLSYEKEAGGAWERVRGGDAAAALILRPPTKEQVARVAEAGETMPPKSTYFFPKLLTGVAFLPLGDD
jgi:uncharacterized protein (DUF1015 family)